MVLEQPWRLIPIVCSLRESNFWREDLSMCSNIVDNERAWSLDSRVEKYREQADRIREIESDREENEG